MNIHHHVIIKEKRKNYENLNKNSEKGNIDDKNIKNKNNQIKLKKCIFLDKKH